MAQREDKKPLIRKMLSEGAKPAEIARALEVGVGYVRQVARGTK